MSIDGLAMKDINYIVAVFCFLFGVWAGVGLTWLMQWWERRRRYGTGRHVRFPYGGLVADKQLACDVCAMESKGEFQLCALDCCCPCHEKCEAPARDDTDSADWWKKGVTDGGDGNG